MENIPKISKGDIVHKVVKGGLSAIPFAGGLAAEFFDLVIKPPLSKRLDAWMESVTEGLKGLEEKVEGFKVEDLSQNEMFITTFMQATQAATRNHQKEKLEALKNAALNAALPNAPEDDIKLIFLNFVDILTPWHLRILRFFNNPKEWLHNHEIKVDINDLPFGYSSVKVLERIFPKLQNKGNFCEIIVRDLLTKDLLSGDAITRVLPEDHIFSPGTSELGKQFIQFITSPFEKDNNLNPQQI